MQAILINKFCLANYGQSGGQSYQRKKGKLCILIQVTDGTKTDQIDTLIVDLIDMSFGRQWVKISEQSKVIDIAGVRLFYGDLFSLL